METMGSLIKILKSCYKVIRKTLRLETYWISFIIQCDFTGKMEA